MTKSDIFSFACIYDFFFVISIDFLYNVLLDIINYSRIVSLNIVISPCCMISLFTLSDILFKTDSFARVLITSELVGGVQYEQTNYKLIRRAFCHTMRPCSTVVIADDHSGTARVHNQRAVSGIHCNNRIGNLLIRRFAIIRREHFEICFIKLDTYQATRNRFSCENIT